MTLHRTKTNLSITKDTIETILIKSTKINTFSIKKILTFLDNQKSYSCENCGCKESGIKYYPLGLIDPVLLCYDCWFVYSSGPLYYEFRQNTRICFCFGHAGIGGTTCRYHTFRYRINTLCSKCNRISFESYLDDGPDEICSNIINKHYCYGSIIKYIKPLCILCNIRPCYEHHKFCGRFCAKFYKVKCNICNWIGLRYSKDMKRKIVDGIEIFECSWCNG